jgi:hypothetical protein
MFCGYARGNERAKKESTSPSEFEHIPSSGGFVHPRLAGTM